MLATKAKTPRHPPPLALPSDVEPYIIGLWRFREARSARRWCATYCYRGYYYDVADCATLDDAVNEVRAGLLRLRRARSLRRA